MLSVPQHQNIGLLLGHWSDNSGFVVTTSWAQNHSLSFSLDERVHSWLYSLTELSNKGSHASDTEDSWRQVLYPSKQHVGRATSLLRSSTNPEGEASSHQGKGSCLRQQTYRLSVTHSHASPVVWTMRRHLTELRWNEAIVVRLESRGMFQETDTSCPVPTSLTSRESR